MVKRAISGKGRRGAPPLPRQRRALRVVQVSLLALGLFLGNLAYRSWTAYSAGEANAGLDEAAFLTAAAVGAVAAVLWMGLRTVRGPQPPALD
ncbi:MAG TPA: hypothetical protein VHJ78_10435 [Actinomycetota bacterium]|nr:hypothetical protein [Actinomycetota bacterium]